MLTTSRLWQLNIPSRNRKTERRFYKPFYTYLYKVYYYSVLWPQNYTTCSSGLCLRWPRVIGPVILRAQSQLQLVQLHSISNVTERTTRHYFQSDPPIRWLQLLSFSRWPTVDHLWLFCVNLKGNFRRYGDLYHCLDIYGLAVIRYLCRTVCLIIHEEEQSESEKMKIGDDINHFKANMDFIFLWTVLTSTAVIFCIVRICCYRDSSQGQ